MRQLPDYIVLLFSVLFWASCHKAGNPAGPSNPILIPNDELPRISAICASDGNLIAGGFGNGSIVYLFRSTDNGSNWEMTDSILVNNHTPGTGLFLIPSVTLFVSGNSIFAGIAAFTGGVYISTNDGLSWSQNDHGFTQNVNCFAAINKTVFAGTDFGVFCSTNGGMSWNATANIPNRIVVRLATLGNFLIAGAGGIFLSSDEGGTWSEVDNGLTNKYVTALTVLGTDVFTGTFKNANDSTSGVFISTDNGGSWSAANVGLTNQNIGVLYGYGSELFVGTYNGIFFSTNNGETWVGVPTKTQLDSSGVVDLSVSGSYMFAVTGWGWGGRILSFPLSQLSTEMRRAMPQMPSKKKEK